MRTYLSLATLTFILISCSPQTTPLPVTIPITIVSTNTFYPTVTQVPTETPTVVAKMPDILQNLPQGFIVVRNADNSWGVGIENGTQTEAIPGISVDPAGTKLELTLSDKTVVDVLPSEMKSGKYSPYQIYNEAGTGIDYAWDVENNVWIKATDVLQPDNSNAENYIKYDTIDDWLKANRLEDMLLPPFDPGTTYFPDLTKIYTTDWNNVNSSHYTIPGSEFNFMYPFGKLPEGMQSPFRFTNFVNIGDGKSYGYTEQIYNPKDHSFTLIHEIFDNTDTIKWSMLLRVTNTAENRFDLPCYAAGVSGILTDPRYQNAIIWLKTNGYMDASGDIPKVKAWVIEWLTTDYLSPEIENILTYTCPKAFPRE